MTNQNSSFSLFSMEEEKFNQIVAVLIALVTMLGAIVAYLQSDASARDDQANRDSKRYSVEAFGRQVSGDAKVNFDSDVAYQLMYEMNLLSYSAYNREDESAANRYDTLSQETTQLSPLLQPPYYTPGGEAEPNVASYEADTYLVELSALRENFLAASAVKDAWDAKANTYIIHLTLLAVALFLFGLSSTIAGPLTRWIFSGTAIAVTILTMVWAGTVWAKPVFDLRQQGNAINDYAAGVGLAHQDRNEEAIAAFTKAIEAHPHYANALVERAGAYMNTGDYEAAVADYAAARAAGDKSANLAGDLAWAYYLLGKFDQAIEFNRIALQSSPDELWIQFDLALSQLAAGQIEAAQSEYAKGMELAASQVAATKAAGGEPPSYLWWGLQDAADSLDGLLVTLEAGEGEPAPALVKDAAMVSKTGANLLAELKGQALALEYTGLPPQGELTAEISPLTFAIPVYDDNGEVVDYEGPLEEMQYGVKEFSVLFDYAGMQDGQEYAFKLYIDGAEDPSWRIVDAWSLGESGSAEIPISYAYSDSFTFEPGEYVVEFYVDWKLAQRASFVVLEE